MAGRGGESLLSIPSHLVPSEDRRQSWRCPVEAIMVTAGPSGPGSTIGLGVGWGWDERRGGVGARRGQYCQENGVAPSELRLRVPAVTWTHSEWAPHPGLGPHPQGTPPRTPFPPPFAHYPGRGGPGPPLATHPATRPAGWELAPRSQGAVTSPERVGCRRVSGGHLPDGRSHVGKVKGTPGWARCQERMQWSHLGIPAVRESTREMTGTDLHFKASWGVSPVWGWGHWVPALCTWGQEAIPTPSSPAAPRNPSTDSALGTSLAGAPQDVGAEPGLPV